VGLDCYVRPPTEYCINVPIIITIYKKKKKFVELFDIFVSLAERSKVWREFSGVTVGHVAVTSPVTSRLADVCTSMKLLD